MRALQTLAIVASTFATASSAQSSGSAAEIAPTALGVLPTVDAEGEIVGLKTVEAAAASAAVDAANARGVTCKLPTSFIGAMRGHRNAGTGCAPNDPACLAEFAREQGVGHWLVLVLDAQEDGVWLDVLLLDAETKSFVRDERTKLPQNADEVPVAVEQTVAFTLNRWEPRVAPVAAPTEKVVVLNQPAGTRVVFDDHAAARNGLYVGGGVGVAGGLAVAVLGGVAAAGGLGFLVFGPNVPIEVVQTYATAQVRGAARYPGVAGLVAVPVGIGIAIAGGAAIASGALFFTEEEPPPVSSVDVDGSAP